TSALPLSMSPRPRCACWAATKKLIKSLAAIPRMWRRLLRRKATPKSNCMAYRLKASESVPEGIKRIVLEEIDSATSQLSHATGKKRDEAIHEARKSIKKIRGVLRMIRPELGGIFRVENTRLRDIGRKLSEIRDAEGVIEVYDGLLEQYKDGLQAGSLVSIRRGLEKNKRQTEQAANLGGAVPRAISTLRAAGRRVKTWPLRSDGFQAISAGLENVYQRG